MDTCHIEPNSHPQQSLKNSQCAPSFLAATVRATTNRPENMLEISNNLYPEIETEQDPTVLAPHVLHLCKNFSQRISLIREVRKYRNKGKQSKETK